MSSVLAGYRPGTPDSLPLGDTDLYDSRRARITRWLVLAGWLLAAVTSFLPWMTHYVPATDFDHPARTIADTGMSSGEAPGAEFLLFASVALVVSWLRSIAESRTRTFQLMPAILGLACLFLALDDYQSLSMKVSRYAQIAPGFWAFFVASIWIAGATTATSIWIVRERAIRNDSWPTRAFGQAAHALSAGIGGIVLAVVLVVVLLPAADEPDALTKIGLVTVGAPVCALVLYLLMTFLIGIAHSFVPERSRRP